MAKEHRPLLMRSNRLLGASLVERNLVKIEDLEAATEKLIEFASGHHPRQCTILGILAYEMKVVKEDEVLHHGVDQDGIGLVDLRDYEVPDEVKNQLDLGVCWATWSVPFDREENFTFIATAYYLSPAVRSFWERQLETPILWFVTSMENIGDFLRKLKLERENEGSSARPS